MTAKPAANPRSLLTPAGLHILMSLAAGVRHGYGIKRDVEEATGGSLHLGPGTLYEAIHRMERSGWIEETGAPTSAGTTSETDAGSRRSRRKYYRLTEEGSRRLHEELERLDAVLEHARANALMPRRRVTR